MYLYRDLRRKSFVFVLKKGIPSLISFLLLPAIFVPVFLAGTFFPWDVIGLLLFSLPGLIEIGRMVYALRGGYQSRVRRYIAQSPNPDLTLEQMERAYSQADRRLSHLCIAGPWVLVQDGAATHLYETSEILWVYRFVQDYPRDHYGGNFLVVCDAGGHRDKFPLSETMLMQALSAFEAYAPFVVLGFSDALLRLYQNDLQGFARQVRQRQQAMNTAMGGQNTCIFTAN